MTLLEDGEGARGDVCERCGRICEPVELDHCPICRKAFCPYCTYRIGSRNYCSRPCGDAFFFGGDGDVDDENLPED